MIQAVVLVGAIAVLTSSLVTLWHSHQEIPTEKRKKVTGCASPQGARVSGVLQFVLAIALLVAALTTRTWTNWIT